MFQNFAVVYGYKNLYNTMKMPLNCLRQCQMYIQYYIKHIHNTSYDFVISLRPLTLVRITVSS